MIETILIETPGKRFAEVGETPALQYLIMEMELYHLELYLFGRGIYNAFVRITEREGEKRMFYDCQLLPADKRGLFVSGYVRRILDLIKENKVHLIPQPALN